jgi:hypothetical protein
MEHGGPEEPKGKTMALDATCANHPGRVASARCPSCSRAICSECAIKVEGINVCSACLAKQARRVETRRQAAGREGIASQVLLSLLGLAGLTFVLFLYALLLSMIL